MLALRGLRRVELVVACLPRPAEGPMHPAAHRHTHTHAFTSFNAREPEGLTLLTRRNLLKAGLAGIAGLTVPELLRQRARAAEAGRALSRKSVILLWMAGGPSHIDTWDP